MPLRLAHLLLFSLITACTHTPRAADVCPQCLPLTLLSGTSIPIKAWLRQKSSQPSASGAAVVHVYLEGDGRNWWLGRFPPANPTSRQFTALKLMNLDPADALYLDRPCYGWKRMPEACGVGYWTQGRYSAKVVERLDRALDELKKRRLGDARLVLIGHSGGGSLAMLLAAQRTDVIGVITLAANLDHHHWTKLKGYSPLLHSLNASDVELPSDIFRWHFAGARDTQVPAQVTAKAASADPYASFELLQDYDHACCWQQMWPKVLHKLDHLAL